MSLLASSPGGLAEVGWRRLIAVTAAFCLAPAAMGAVALGIVNLLGPERLGPGHTYWDAFATFAAASPLVTWPVWAAIGGGAAWLLHRGGYGSLSAVALGGVAGGLAALAIDQPLVAPLGAVLATFHRFALALLRPLAF